LKPRNGRKKSILELLLEHFSLERERKLAVTVEHSTTNNYKSEHREERIFSPGVGEKARRSESMAST